jgi:polysaccharide biosynthesis/export protein
MNLKKFFIAALLAVSWGMPAVSAGSLGSASPNADYAVGVGDVLEISVLQPDQFITNVTVAPDGSISFPYLGNVKVKGMNLQEIHDMIEQKLSDDYIKYPLITVYLRETKSKKYLVSGEVVRPGAYLLEDNMTVMRAVSIAGGLTKYGNPGKVKVLRLKPDGAGYQPIHVNLKRAMDGDMAQDVMLEPDDMIVVSEGIF